MMPQLKKDADDGLTLIIQNESPGTNKEANWLPAPKGPFVMFMRLYCNWLRVSGTAKCLRLISVRAISFMP